MDAELRAAERSGDNERLILLRQRAGRCAGCGGKHEGVDTIILGPQIHDEISIEVRSAHSPHRVGTGGWYWSPWHTKAGAAEALIDPCGRAVVWYDHVDFLRKEEHTRWWARQTNGILLYPCCHCGHASDVPVPEFVKSMGVLSVAGAPGGGFLCYRCETELRAEAMEDIDRRVDYDRLFPDSEVEDE